MVNFTTVNANPCLIHPQPSMVSSGAGVVVNFTTVNPDPYFIFVYSSMIGDIRLCVDSSKSHHLSSCDLTLSLSFTRDPQPYVIHLLSTRPEA
jgi:hypothetical protein